MTPPSGGAFRLVAYFEMRWPNSASTRLYDGCQKISRSAITALERGDHAFGHRQRHELVRVRDAFMRRSDDALSHLRLGCRRTRRRREAIRRSIQSPTHSFDEVGCEGRRDRWHPRVLLVCPRRVVDACDATMSCSSTQVERTGREYHLFRKPSENEGSETQQRRCLVSPKMSVPNILIFGTLQP